MLPVDRGRKYLVKALAQGILDFKSYAYVYR